MNIKNRKMTKTTMIGNSEYGFDDQGRLYQKLYGAYEDKKTGEYHLEGRWHLVRWTGTGLAYRAWKILNKEVKR